MIEAISNSRYFNQLARGDYQTVVLEAVDSHSAKWSIEELPWIIASLCFVGRFEESKGLFDAHSFKLSSNLRIASRFFLAVTHSREGRMREARQELSFSYREFRLEPNLFSQFFVFQGFAFYRYTSGRVQLAKQWALKALAASAGLGFSYGAILANEILGHIHLSSGLFPAGFRYFSTAKSKAEILGQGAVLKAIDSSSLLYRASFGIADSSRDLLEALEAGLSQEGNEDSYTQAALSLEIARILLLRGELKSAKNQLEASSELVYRIDNPELEMDHNLQLAQLLKVQGELHQSLSIVRGLRQRLQFSENLIPRLKVLGLECQLLKSLGRIKEYEEKLPELEKLTFLTETLMASRQLQRLKLSTENSAARLGEDSLGDLYDQLSRPNQNLTESILKGEWYGLLSMAWQVRSDERALAFDAEIGSLTIFNAGQVCHLRGGCTGLLRSLLILLAQGPASKELLTHRLWQQSYNPSRHDALIYALISKARKFLGANGNWIEVYELGYRYVGNVRIIPLNLANHQNENTSEEYLGDYVSELNARQIQILEILGATRTIEPAELVRRLGVSDATISRDMAVLTQRGHTERTGRGRATRYRISPHIL